jgi:Flp pilus assembly pilin Flp
VRRDDERGASVIEYAFLVALISLVCVVAVVSIGRTTSGSLSGSASSLSAP